MSKISKESEVDLIDIAQFLWNKKWIILISTLLGLFIAILALRFIPKVYQADLLLKIEKNKDIGAAILGNLDGILNSGGEEANTQIKIINSRSILGKTVDDFNLQTKLKPQYQNQIDFLLTPPKPIPKSEIIFNINYPNNYESIDHSLTLHIPSADEVRLYDGKQLIIEGQHGTTLYSSGYTLFFDSGNEDLTGQTFSIENIGRLEAIDELRKQLSITSVNESSLLDLRLTDTDPNYAAELLNNIANNYVQHNNEDEIARMVQGIEFIENQLPVLRERLEKAEEALSSYQIEHETIDMTIEGDTLIKSLANIETRLTELQLQVNSLESKYTVNHPALKALLRQREVLENRRTEIENQLENVPMAAQGLVRLTRDVEVNQAIYLQLLSKVQELKVIKASSGNNVNIIDRALPNSKFIKPRKIVVLVVGMAIGIFLSSFLLIIRYLTRNSIVTIEDVTENTQLDVIGTIPESKTQLKYEKKLRNKNQYSDEENILTIIEPQDLAIEALRSLRTSLYFAMQNSDNNTILISGPTEDVGKSFVSSNLAVLLAQSGKSVVFINGDLRKGYLDKQFKLDESKTTLTEFLKNPSDPHLCIHGTKIQGLKYIPCGQKPNNPSEILSSEKFSSLITYLQKNFDFVLIDAPPILPVADTLQVSRLVSTVLFVVRCDKTTVKELQLATNKFGNSQTKIAGVVINGIQKQKNKGYYSYHYSYKENSQ